MTSDPRLLLPDFSPWAKLNHLAPANIKWCEATVPGWITEPANTWTNLAYVLVAILIWKKYPKIAYATLFLGLGSGIYHATNNFFTQLWDFVGMYAVLALFIVINCARIGMKKSSLNRIYWGGAAIFTSLCVILYFINLPYQALVLFMILGLVLSEVKAKNNSAGSSHKKSFYTALFFIAVAAVFSFSDHKGWFCDPDNHLVQGHAIWHILSATAIYFATRYYGQHYDTLKNV